MRAAVVLALVLAGGWLAGSAVPAQLPDGREHELRRAYELAPRDPIVNYNLGLLHHEIGELEDAEFYYSVAVYADRWPWPDAAANLGLLFNRSGREEESIRLLEYAIKHGAYFHVACWTNLIVAHKRLGDDASARNVAVNALRYGVELDPGLVRYAMETK